MAVSRISIDLTARKHTVNRLLQEVQTELDAIKGKEAGGTDSEGRPLGPDEAKKEEE